MSLKDHYVIIGNGPAGNHAAATLRKKDNKARITIISDEIIPYYYKPGLTEFIEGKIPKEKLIVYPADYYTQKNIRVRLGQIVKKIDPDSKSIFLQHMEKINYTKLVIASGIRANILPSMSHYAHNLKFITSYTDVMENKEKIMNSKNFFVFGGDFVGFQFIKMLNSMGKNVMVLIDSDAFWPYSLTKEMLEKISHNLSKSNIKIIVNDNILNISEEKGLFKIITLKGIKKIFDMVFSFNGMNPNISFSKGSGIDIDHGILVNEYLRTNVDSIYACGSCAQIYNRSIKSYATTIGWPNAAVQGEISALNLLGDNKIIEPVGRKYFDLEGVKIKTTWWEDMNLKS